MKYVFTMMSAALLCGGASAASAMPHMTTSTPTPVASIEQARVVCNYRRCFRTGYRGYYYRPYGYYRPYYYRPGIGIGVGPVGVRIF